MHEVLHTYGMELALREAEKARGLGEVPAGCVILRPPAGDAIFKHPSLARVLGRAHNQTETLRDPTAHAEMLAITQAAEALDDWRLANTILYVTKEPCPMCAGAIVLARVPLVVYGLPDPRRGGISVFNILRHEGLNHQAEIIPGVLEQRCREQLTTFFRDCREGRILRPGRSGADVERREHPWQHGHENHVGGTNHGLHKHRNKNERLI